MWVNDFIIFNSSFTKFAVFIKIIFHFISLLQLLVVGVEKMVCPARITSPIRKHRSDMLREISPKQNSKPGESFAHTTPKNSIFHTFIDLLAKNLERFVNIDFSFSALASEIQCYYVLAAGIV